jgi:methylglyoxal reductase
VSKLELLGHKVGTVKLPTGADVARLGIGCWGIGGPDDNLGLPMGWSTSDDSEARRGLELAYELGANLYDTADVYGHGRSERLLGSLLRQVPRSTVAVTSKVGYFAGTAENAYDPHHIRRQLEQSLRNLRTDYLDVYFLHNANFGSSDRYLEGALTAMQDFKREGLIRSIGMRGPHRYAPERLTTADACDKNVRFRKLFDIVQPEVLTVRYNLLTPDNRGGIFDLAAQHGTVVLLNKPLAQGLLTGKYSASAPPQFGLGDHRSRKRWFTPSALAVLSAEIEPLRQRFGSDGLTRIALRYCLQRFDQSAVLVGFTNAAQIRKNITCLGEILSDSDLSFISSVGERIMHALNAQGGVFLDDAREDRA